MKNSLSEYIHLIKIETCERRKYYFVFEIDMNETFFFLFQMNLFYLLNYFWIVFIIIRIYLLYLRL